MSIWIDKQEISIVVVFVFFFSFSSSSFFFLISSFPFLWYSLFLHNSRAESFCLLKIESPKNSLRLSRSLSSCSNSNSNNYFLLPRHLLHFFLLNQYFHTIHTYILIHEMLAHFYKYLYINTRTSLYTWSLIPPETRDTEVECEFPPPCIRPTTAPPCTTPECL